MTFFSIIVPVHNKERHLERSLSSITNQSFDDFEIIVIDDASTDGSARVLNSFADSRIKLFKRDKPGPGGYAARNLGIKESNGQWICFLDADDCWEIDHLEKKKQLITENPTINFFSCNWHAQDLKKNYIPPSFYKNHEERLGRVVSANEYLRLCLSDMRPIHTNVVCINRKAIPTEKLFPEGKTNRTGDVYTWLYLALYFNELCVGNFTGATRYTDTDNRVSRNAHPNTAFFRSIYGTLLTVNPESTDNKLLRRYCNRLYCYALKESALSGKNKLHDLLFIDFMAEFYTSMKTVLAAMTPHPLLKYAVKKKREMSNRL